MADVAQVTESVAPDVGVDCLPQRHRAREKGGRYLPSAQVLNELASLGPDLGRLAEDLRVRLSDPTDGIAPFAV